MGLSFSHSKASWSYSGFDKFRHDLAEMVGIELDSMIGFGGQAPWTSDDPIVLLLNHSDCDGELSSSKCQLLWPRLAQLAVDLPENYDKENALLLADDLRRCAKDGLAMEFC